MTIHLYVEHVDALANPANDAVAMAMLFKNAGFAIVQAKGDLVLLLPAEEQPVSPAGPGQLGLARRGRQGSVEFSRTR